MTSYFFIVPRDIDNLCESEHTGGILYDNIPILPEEVQKFQKFPLKY